MRDAASVMITALRWHALHPRAFDLALVCSPAARIEPALVRSLRLALVPRAHAAAEADLWFSPLVQFRSAQGLVMAPGIAELLRERLASDEARFTAACDAIARAHEHLPDLVRLEERLTRIAFSKNASLASIDDELGRQLRAMTESPARAAEIATWFLRALPRLPDRVRASSSAWALAIAAGARLGVAPSLGGDAPPGAVLAFVPALLPASMRDTEIGVERRGDVLSLGVPVTDATRVVVPDTTPLLLEIETSDGRHVVALRRGETRTLDVKGAASLRTLRGHRYELRARTSHPTTSAEGNAAPEAPRGVETIFIGRAKELAMLQVLLQGITVVAIRGPAGVGKSYLADRFAYLNKAAFPGGYVRVALGPEPVRSEIDVEAEVARKLACARAEIRARLVAPRLLLHIEDIDDEVTARAVLGFTEQLRECAVIASGRAVIAKTAVEINLAPFAPVEALALLDAEAGPASNSAAVDERRRLVTALQGMPLALHVAACHLRAGGNVEAFLAKLNPKAASSVQPAFEAALDALRSTLGEANVVAFAALGNAPRSGVGKSLGAAMAGLDEASFETLMRHAVLRALAEVVPEREAAWKIHPLLAEMLRPRADRAWLQRTTSWFIDRFPPLEAGDATRWPEINAEVDGLVKWLGDVPIEDAARVERAGSPYAITNGPFAAWLAFCDRILAATTEPAQRSQTLWTSSQIALRAGELERAEAAAREKEAIDRERGAEREVAIAKSGLAEVLQARGHYDEALRIRREEVLPIFERVGDVKASAVNLSQIADALHARGEVDEALRIQREEVLPRFEKISDAFSSAVTLGKIADTLQIRGQLDEALRIRREQELPLYDRIGNVHARAATDGKIADVLQMRGELDEALRIRQEQLRDYDQVGDMRGRAVTLGRIADVLETRGQLDEATRIRREEVIPIFERLGDTRSRAGTLSQIADVLETRGQLDEATRIRREEILPIFDQLGDAGARAAILSKNADVLETRGELDEALRIQRDEVLPVFERLRDERARAVTLGKIADILRRRGELDEALRIQRDEVLPVFERLGDLRELAVTLGKIADVHQARGELDEALRIRRAQQLPLCERLGDAQGLVTIRTKLARTYLARGGAEDRTTAAALLHQALEGAEAMHIPEADEIRALLRDVDSPSIASGREPR